MTEPRTAKALPGIFIFKEEVNQRVKNYLQTKHTLLTSAIGKDDTKSAWYSLEQFEELMREMYYLNADGLRIYFGAYSADDEEYPNQLTVIFVPTHLSDTGSHTDIIIDDEQNFMQRTMVPATLKNLDTIGLCPPSCSDQDTRYPLD
jgi:hypothetical protein